MDTANMAAGRGFADGGRGGPLAESFDAALAARKERFERRADDGTLDLAAVLHDARTPLTVIAASAGMALRDAPESARPHLERVRESARVLEEILVKGLERLRANPEGAAADLGALLLAAAALPSGEALTLGSELVLDAAGAPFAVRATVETTDDRSDQVPLSARRAVLRHGGALWGEARPEGGTRYVAELPCPRAA
ncbi:hypothetical protein EPO15_02400 [bacterium]|nr:MAG: hypothetical protein EPO15_02400 [bacterium]